MTPLAKSLADDQAQMKEKFHEGQTEGLHAVMRDNMALQKEIADLRIKLALRSDEAKPVPMTDLEDFTAFFKSKGVKFTVDGPDDRKGTWVCVHDAQFWFNDHGNYTGTYNYESGHFAERLPAPEGG